MGLNRVTIVGRLTRDAELTYTQSGKAVASFGVAIARDMSREAQDAAKAQGQPTCDFVDCTAWEKTAEYVCNYLGKGRLVSVDGRLRQEIWQDKTTHQNRSKLGVVAQSVQGLDRAPEDGVGAAAPAAAAPAAAPPPGSRPASAAAPQSDNLADYVDPFGDQ